jgi:hypothetical protein
MKTKAFLPIVVLLSFSNLIAQNTSIAPKPNLVLELPLIDLPYQIDAAKTVNDGQVTVGSFFKGYANPSMHQSLSITTNLYTGLHYGIGKLFVDDSKKAREQWTFGKNMLYISSLIAADYISVYAPGFDGWLHEEYHRSVMTRYHVNSFNMMNTFPIGSDLVSVNKIKDDDLVRFKSQSPSDFIRMHVAGIEGEYLMIDKLQRNNFYYNQNLTHEFLYIMSALNSIAYVGTCVDPELSDVETDKMNQLEHNIADRDFTGLDFLGWTYDLFHPNEPYTERGNHPLGNGIDRYIKTTDLNDDELKYLKKQGNLQWLNLLSPMMIGFRSIPLSPKGLYGNFAVRHLLTSFGSDISLTAYLMNPHYKWLFAYHSAKNYNRAFPSVEAQLTDYEAALGNHRFYMSPRLIIGAQPQNQIFKTNHGEFLGLAECKVELRAKSHIQPYIELSAKTDGWIAGNEFLDSMFGFRFGVTGRFNR